MGLDCLADFRLRFDEVHFGKFAAKYIKTRYYVDVHPPLAKLLITLMSVLGGFDGDFDFKEIGAYVSSYHQKAHQLILHTANIPQTSPMSSCDPSRLS